jgi:hypothetical protein
MGMIGLLVALYPRRWREEFGGEFAALLEQTRLTPARSPMSWPRRPSGTPKATRG